MKITKFGHSSLLVEENGKRVIVDPGKFGPAMADLKNIDVVVVTHEHFDHLDPLLIKNILSNNSAVKVVANAAVGALLAAEGIPFVKIEDKEAAEVNGVLIEGVGNEHIIFGEGRGKCQNTGYLFFDKLYYAGDSYAVPAKKVPVLALPVGGPWLTTEEAMRFLVKVGPQACVPVHDGFDSQVVELARMIADETIVKFVPLPIGVEIEID